MAITQGTRWAALGRPALRPGLHVVRRDDRHLQLGLDEPDRLVLPDLPGLYDALVAPEQAAAVRGDRLRAVLDDLVADGWVVDAAEESRRAAARRARRPAVVAWADAPLQDRTTRLLTAVGLQLREPSGQVAPPSVHLVATAGEPSRTVSDRLVRDDVPHLWLAVLPRAVRIGPYVCPGRSACLRCIDAHLGERDARRATVLHQLEARPADPTPPLDPCLVSLGLSWAARDLVRMLDGEPPALHSATVTVHDTLEVTHRDWLRHPHCGCAWG